MVCNRRSWYLNGIRQVHKCLIEYEKEVNVMILADKIINERKKLGWSQEELADKLGVSRQSVSKWEGAQSVPDLQRILEMSKIFGVSTDYLLKDDIEEVIPSEKSDSDTSLRKLSLEEANTYLDTVKKSSDKIALGVAICTSCAVPLLLLEAAFSAGMGVSEGVAGGLGTVLLLMIVAISLIFIIPAAMALSKWEWLEKESFETEYGVEGAVRSKLEKFEPRFVRGITMGVVTILLGVMLIVSVAFIAEENEPLIIAAAAGLLLFISLGVNTIVRVGMIKDSYSKVLQEEDYSKAKKENKVMNAVAPAYWLLVTAGYLAWSFTTNNWGFTWIVWPIAGIIFGAISAVAEQVTRKD